MKVNFCIFVYIHILDFIGFIANQSFSPKSLTKVYIQNMTNKEIKIPANKKEKARSRLAFLHNQC